MFLRLCTTLFKLCVCVFFYAVGGLVVLDGVASVSGYGAELAQHSGGEGQSN